ncbi:MAG: hypothetical protein IH861_04855 [Chloroflexi bacterium]|nr:hypothetical protein [Chloroflexota bacterium]
MNKENPFSRVRVIVALFSVAAAVGLGLLTPDPRPSAASNAIILGFTVALMMAMATVFAMIPAPPDARRLLRARVFRRSSQPENGSDAERRQAERYTGFGHPVFTRPLPAPDDRAREG